jgi:TolB-like protein
MSTTRAPFLAASLALALAGASLAQDPPPPQPEQPPPAPAPAPQAAQKASLAVVPFTFAAIVRERDRDGDWGWVLKNFETTAFTNKFVTALVQTRKFDVVERSRVDEALKEVQMTQGGLMDPARAIKAGKMIGADYLLMGEISVFEVTSRWLQVPNTSRWSCTVTGRIIVDMRIVDSRTSKVVSADAGEVVHEVQSLHENQLPVVVDGKYIDSLQRLLCESLVLSTIDGVYPVRVASFTEGQATLNRGEGGGLEVGMVLDVYAEGKDVIDPDTGETLGAEEVKIGRIKVIEVLPRFSKAAVVEASAPIPQGAICRKPKAAPAAPQDPPRRGPKW